MTVAINGSGSISGITPGGLPDGTVQQADLAAGVAGNGPTFSAYASAGTAVSLQTYTKVACATKEFDTANCYDTANSRFKPNVPGYYDLKGCVGFPSGSGVCAIYKNGAQAKAGGVSTFTTNIGGTCSVDALVYLDGVNDYVELWFYNTGAVTTSIGSTSSYFQGHLVRAA